MVKGIRSNGGHVEIHLDVQNGVIHHARVFGDFFNIGDIADLEQLQIDAPHNETDIRKKMDRIVLSDYIGQHDG